MQNNLNDLIETSPAWYEWLVGTFGTVVGGGSGAFFVRRLLVTELVELGLISSGIGTVVGVAMLVSSIYTYLCKCNFEEIKNNILM